MGVTVRAAVLHEVGGPMLVEEIQLPSLGERDVRVRLVAAGVCHSDLSLARGDLRQPVPAVLGHEGAGVVEEVGAGVTDVAVGDRVVLCWAPPCRDCWFCRHSEPYLCERAALRAGETYARSGDLDLYPGLGTAAFAEQTVVPDNAVIPVGVDVPMELAALVGCAVLTGFGAVHHSARVSAGESVLVLGLGGVGMSAVQAAGLAGAEPVIVCDPSETKRALALDLGAHAALAPEDTLAKSVRRLTQGRGADHAIECVGSAATIRQAWSATRRGGRTTVVGIGRSDAQVSFSPLEIFHFGRTLAGCVYGNSDPVRDVPVVLEHLAAGRLDLGALITGRIDLHAIDDAFERMAAGEGVRSLVVM